MKEARRRARVVERRPENRIEVAVAPAEVHPTVAATWDALDQASPSEIGLVAVSERGIFHVDVARRSVLRAMHFLNTLVVAAEQRGDRMDEGEAGLGFLVDGQAIDFKLLELVDRTPHAPTEEEKLAVRKWESLQRMLSENKDLEAVMLQPQIPELDLVPSGRLQVVVAESRPGGSGQRRVFGDGERQQIEKLINPTLATLATWAAVIRSSKAPRAVCL